MIWSSDTYNCLSFQSAALLYDPRGLNAADDQSCAARRAAAAGAAAEVRTQRFSCFTHTAIHQCLMGVFPSHFLQFVQMFMTSHSACSEEELPAFSSLLLMRRNSLSSVACS